MIPSLSECKRINPEICRVLSRVLSEIRPSKEEEKHVLVFAENVKKSVEDSLSDLDVPYSVEIHGSIAHNTWLSNDRDIDIFILLGKKVSKEYIVEEILGRLRERLNYRFEQRYAEHPYLRAYVDEFTFDIVPGFSVGEIISAVDRTPLHTRFIKEKLSVELMDEVRLLKSFLKGIGTYGAEIKTQGLSGYACELLIIHFGSFLSTLKAFSREKRIFIDFTGTWDREKAFEEFKKKIILIDPVDRNRNVTANTSTRAFYLIKLASKLFLDNPSIKFFFPCREIELKQLSEIKNREIIMILLEKNEDVPPDTYWGQARRVEKLVRKFIRNIRDIYLFATDLVDTDKYMILFIEVSKTQLNEFKEIKGPPVWANSKDISKFINEYMHKAISGPWLKGSRIVFLAKRSRSERSLINKLERFLGKIRMDPSFRKFNVLESYREGITLLKKQGAYNALLRFINRRLPWLECSD